MICWGDIDGGYRKLAHRGSYENLVWVSLSTLYRVLAAQGLVLPARSQRAPAVARPLPDWIEWKRHQIWIYDTTHFPRAGRVAYAILDVVRTFTQKHLTLPAGRSCSTGTLTHHGNDKHVAIVGRLRCRSLRGRQSGGWGALPIRNPRIE